MKNILKKAVKCSIFSRMQKTRDYKPKLRDHFQFTMFGVFLYGAGLVIRTVGATASLFSRSKA
jgi:hypothetical protein